MLRIQVEEQCESVKIRLEGRLAGDWVEELKHCWHTVRDRSRDRTLVVELLAVSFVDISGHFLLAEMYRSGAKLVGRGIFVEYLVQRIQQSAAG